MKLDEQALPLTQGQLDVWLAQEITGSGTEWQMGHFVVIEGTVNPDLLESAICQVVREAEPIRATFFQVDGQVFQRTIGYPDVELARYDLSCSQDPVREAYRLASSIQRSPMPLTGPLFKFALFQTRPDQFRLFTCIHHIVIDGSGIKLICNRIAEIYSALASGAPVPPAFFGSLQDLVTSELEYESSCDYLEDQAYWSSNLPSENALNYRLPQAAGERDPYSPSAPVRLDPAILRRIHELAEVWKMPPVIGDHRGVRTLTNWLGRLVRRKGPEAVLDFPVSRRSAPGSRNGFPRWLPGWCRWC